MSAILTVMRKELRETVRDRRSFLGSILFGPVLVPAMFALIIAITLRHSIAQTDAPLEIAVSHSERAPNLMARLSEHVHIQNYDVTVLEAIYHVVEHFAQHYGQITFATKLFTQEDLGFYAHLSKRDHRERTP